MPDHSLPEKAAKPVSWRLVVVVFLERANRVDATNAHDDPLPRVLYERDLLGIEKHERVFGPNVLPETVEQSSVISMVLRD